MQWYIIQSRHIQKIPENFYAWIVSVKIVENCENKICLFFLENNQN